MSGLFIGLASLDILYELSRLPLENQKGRSHGLQVISGGPAANAAATFSLLGGKPKLITAIGSTDIGTRISSDYTSIGIEIIDYIIDSNTLPCVASIAINPTNGNRTIWGSPAPRTRSCEKAEIRELLSGTDFVLADGYLAEIALPIMFEAREMGIPTLIDAGSWKPNFELFLKLANTVIASNDCTPPIKYGENIEVAALRLGAREAATTHGSDAITWKTSTDAGHVSVTPVEAVDTLGAGDVFHGAFCYFYYKIKTDFITALHAASKVASESVRYAGPREGVIRYAMQHSTLTS